MLSERLKYLRTIHKIYQKDMAKLLDITERAYRNYEAGKIDLSASKLIFLADYFDVSVDYLLGRTDNPKINK